MLDPRCCQALSSSLQLLNIAYTQTQDLSGVFVDFALSTNIERPLITPGFPNMIDACFALPVSLGIIMFALGWHARC